jgi:hypothetical protein
MVVVPVSVSIGECDERAPTQFQVAGVGVGEVEMPLPASCRSVATKSDVLLRAISPTATPLSSSEHAVKTIALHTRIVGSTQLKIFFMCVLFLSGANIQKYFRMTRKYSAFRLRP